MVTVGWDTSALKVLTSSAGTGIVCEGCCGGVSCGYCSGTTPASFSLYFEDVVGCNPCFVVSPDDSRQWLNLYVPVDTDYFTLNQRSGSPCIWEGWFYLPDYNGTNVTLRRFTEENDCTGTYSDTDYDYLYIKYQVYSAASGVLTVGFVPDVVTYGSGVFQGVATTDVCEPDPLSNSYTTCPTSGVVARTWYNGTAHLT